MPDDAANPLGTDNQPLRDLSPHEIAAWIRGLDSRLVGIDYDDSAGRRVLVYHFEVAGQVTAFPVLVDSLDQPSIADLYPEASERERELHRAFGLIFHRPNDRRAKD